MWNGLSEWWCRTMHSKTSWPVNGRYVCLTCHREYPVVWEAGTPTAVSAFPGRPRPASRLEASLEEWVRKMSGLEEWLRRIAWSAKILLHRLAG